MHCDSTRSQSLQQANVQSIVHDKAAGKRIDKNKGLMPAPKDYSGVTRERTFGSGKVNAQGGTVHACLGHCGVLAGGASKMQLQPVAMDKTAGKGGGGRGLKQLLAKMAEEIKKDGEKAAQMPAIRGLTGDEAVSKVMSSCSDIPTIRTCP